MADAADSGGASPDRADKSGNADRADKTGEGGRTGKAGRESPGLPRKLLVDIGPLRDSPDFRRLWFGQTVSTAGNMVTGVVVPVQVYAMTRSPAAVGAVSLVEAVPTIALGLFGGSLADSFDRRRLFALTSGLSALVSVLFALQAALGVRRPWVLLVLAGIQASLFALSTPVSRTFMPLLLPAERYTEGAALQQMSFQASIVAGPLLAGVLIASAGAGTAFAVDAVSFAFVVHAALRLPPMPARRKTEASGLASVGEGLRFVRDHAALRSILLLDVNNTVFGMPFALFPAFAEGQLHGGPRTAGLLYAAPAAGGVLAAAMSGGLPGVRRQGRALLAAGCCWGLAVAGFGLARSLWLAVPLLALAGAADMVGGVLRSAILQTRTPDALRGRVNAVGFVTGEAGPRLGNAEAGAVGSLVSPAFSAVSGGAACLAGLVLTAATTPALLRYEPVPQPGPSAPVASTS
ncbi:MFS transporter [Streptomyces sp. NRRL F-5123]|uniref:MFS transporter n=1 Tax=Streptomyces sp. NRRL F-5123 TaxID=1463856 RepID=UPI0018FF6026|nr:MFS transporter [Streptomyces sp. NRRL F-5123]